MLAFGVFGPVKTKEHPMKIVKTEPKSRLETLWREFPNSKTQPSCIT